MKSVFGKIGGSKRPKRPSPKMPNRPRKPKSDTKWAMGGDKWY